MLKPLASLIVFMSLILSGCASNLYGNKPVAIDALHAALVGCQASIPDDARQALSTKVEPLSKYHGFRDVDFADSRVPLEEDFPWLRKYKDAELFCMASLDRWAEKHADQAKPLMVSYRTRRNSVYDGLFRKEITYGLAKKELSGSSSDFITGLSVLEEELYVKRQRDTATLIGLGVLIYTIESRTRR